MSITEFLEARIEQDERAARRLAEARHHLVDPLAERFLAECAAKRELVDTWHDEHGGGLVLKTLAAVYAGHPDYRNEWAA